MDIHDGDQVASLARIRKEKNQPTEDGEFLPEDQFSGDGIEEEELLGIPEGLDQEADFSFDETDDEEIISDEDQEE